MLKLPPLSLYVHIPWCVRKCPYCDFNSHETTIIPEREYLEALKSDLNESIALAQGRKIHSIFFGGGTPSLFQAETIGKIIEHAQALFGFEKTPGNNTSERAETNNINTAKSDIEITLEANPGTAEYTNLALLRDLGVNRLSFGVQSFNDQHLKNLGRIHDSSEAKRAIEAARNANFLNINIDLMHGLQDQTAQQAINDLKTAAQFNPEHLSWYQLTIEPNTVFYKTPPIIPKDEVLADIQDLGLEYLSNQNFERYEISAFSREGRQSQHNLNYWQFGDYLAVGAGAHGKISYANGEIQRYWKTRLPADYLNPNKPFTAESKTIAREDLPLEFMMNALRLRTGVFTQFFEERTGEAFNTIQSKLSQLHDEGLIEEYSKRIACTPKGYEFLNSVLGEFLLD